MHQNHKKILSLAVVLVTLGCYAKHSSGPFPPPPASASVLAMGSREIEIHVGVGYPNSVRLERKGPLDTDFKTILDIPAPDSYREQFKYYDNTLEPESGTNIDRNVRQAIR